MSRGRLPYFSTDSNSIRARAYSPERVEGAAKPEMRTDRTRVGLEGLLEQRRGLSRLARLQQLLGLGEVRLGGLGGARQQQAGNGHGPRAIRPPPGARPT